MNRIAPAALATLLAATVPALLHAQTAFTPPQPSGHFTDPANLGGERVRPLDGRELPVDQGALGLEELLRKLSTRASILNIVAHPDDEDGGMLTLYARGLGARVADLSLTRGEGGQNAETSDFDDALGLLRTQELLANDRYTGVSQMFGTEVDFGFSKTKAEAFSKWGHDRVLYDVVRAIRIYRPLVLTATFIGNATDGHGQHQVSGEIAQEAFVAAGDPNVFPELTREGILPWQPLKIYARVPTYAISDKGLFDYATNQYIPARFTNYVTGEVSTTPPSADVIVHEGDTDPLLTASAANHADLPPSLTTDPTKPLSYVQFARIGLGLQKSQIGPGVRNAPSGAFDSAYHLYGSCVGPSSTPEKICHLAPSCANVSSPSEKICHLDRSLAASSQGAAERPAAPSITQKSVILSEGSHASPRAEAEGPRGSESSHNSPPLFHHEIPSPLDAGDPSFFDGIDTSLDGILSLDKNAPLSDAAWQHFIQSIAQAQQHFDPQHPERIAPLLTDALANINLEIDLLGRNERPSVARENILHELRIKRVQLNDALVLALDLTLDATSPADNLRAGSTAVVTTRLTERSSVPLHNVKEGIVNSSGDGLGDGASSDGEGPRPLPDQPLERTLSLAGPETNRITRPYFFRTNIERPVYELRDPQLRNAAQAPPALTVIATATYNGALLRLARVVHDGPQPVSFVPALSVALSSHAQILDPAQRSLRITATANETGSSEHDDLTLTAPPRWQVQPPSASISNDAIRFTVTPPATNRALATITASGRLDGATYTEGYRPVGYGNLPRTNYFTPATDRIVPVDLNLPPANHRRIAYLPGTGDDVPSALASIGLKPTILTVADLTPEKLKSFDTVILGVRTYNAHPDLHGPPTQALLAFARNGGNVLVQYQSNEFTAADAPYPLSLGSNEKVVDETAPVALLTTENSQLKTDPQTRFAEALLTTPNRITSADFDNWIEERGHGFLSTWDPHYTALTETHDPGAPSEHIAPQLPQRGGLLTVQLGRGRWTYCAFALYRQLPEAVPGAYRLFVNLLDR